ncbi:MAG: ATPase, T2SS/T4P/T4SS family, partial [Sandaracinaceae bacterium]
MTIELSDGTTEALSVPGAGPVVIGRDPTCHIVLPSPDVSRRHLTVEKNGSGYRLTDASANGTFVGEGHLHQTTCDAPGGLPLRVGPYVIVLEALGPPAVAPSPVLSPRPPPRAPAPPPTAGGFSPVSAPTPRAAPPPGARPRPQPAPPAQGPVPGAPPEMPTVPDEAPIARSADASPYDVSGTADVSVAARKRIHRMLLDNLDLASLDRNKMDESLMRPKVRQALRLIMKEVGGDLPSSTNIAQLIDEITDEALGLGPLERLLADESVSEIMVVDPTTIYVERHGKIQSTALRFTDDEAVRAVIERIVTPLGRRIDESTPLVDARLRDGSRVNAVIRPLAIRGSCITIRKFAKVPLTMQNLIDYGSINDAMAKFIRRSVRARKNIVISGGTGSGKSTLLTVLSAE